MQLPCWTYCIQEAAFAMFDLYIEPTFSNLTMNHENTTYP